MVKRYKIKFQKEVKGKEIEIYISKEQVLALYNELMTSNISKDISGWFVYLEKND